MDVKQPSVGGFNENQTNSAAADLKSQAKATGKQMRQGAREAAEQARRSAADATRMVKDQGQRLFNEQRNRVAESLGDVSAALHDAADRLQREKDDNIAAYTNALADGVDRTAGYLRERSLDELVRDVRQMARRQPEWFLGGMFIAGLALARFSKAQPRDQYRFESGRADFGRGEGYSSYNGAGTFEAPASASMESAASPSSGVSSLPSTSSGFGSSFGASCSRPEVH